MRQRWITIGRVERKFVVLGNCGFPDGLSMRWRGRTAWCQPCEFTRWPQLLSAVRTRLRIAGLEMIALASVVPAAGFLGECELKVLIQRASIISRKTDPDLTPINSDNLF